MEHYLEPYYPSLLNILSYENEIHAIPYNNYVMGNHYRADLFEHPVEQANFIKRYGYPLAPPQTVQQLVDIGEFFTRGIGEQLADTKLTKQFYGMALMSGLRPHINDEFSAILWGLDGKWMTPIYKKNKLQHFQVDSQNSALVETTMFYQKLKQYAYPADSQFAFYESAQAMANGQVAMWPFAITTYGACHLKLNKISKAANSKSRKSQAENLITVLMLLPSAMTAKIHKLLIGYLNI